MARARKGETGATARPSRRRIVQAAAAALASGAAATLSAAPVAAQSAAAGADPELSRLQSTRRILLKGGIVLSGDARVGDFAAADILIEDGTIRAVRPGIAADDAAVIDAGNRIVIPGFVDTHSHSYQGLLRDTLPNGLVDPDYNRDIQNNITLHYEPADAHANPGHVDAVLVRGKVKKWRGRLVGVDAARVRRLAGEARDAVLGRSGFKLDLVG